MFRPAVWLTVVVTGIAAAQSPATAPGPATQPALGDGRTDAVLAHIETIRTSDDAGKVMSAYARGNTLDSRSLMLHEAYLRRMLQLGHPQIAQHAARRLLVHESEHPLSLAVLGYLAAQKGQLGEALGYAARSAGGDFTNPSTQHNLGQLMAWYAALPAKPRLSDAAAARIRLSQESWRGQEKYQQAYTTVKADADKQLAAIAAIEARLGELSKQMEPQRAKMAEMDRQYRELDLQFRSADASLKHMQRDLKRAEADYSNALKGDRESVDTLRYRRRVMDLQDEIREQEKVVRDYQARRDEMTRSAQQELAAFKDIEAQIARQQGDLKQAQQALALRFDWWPPAVDGVIARTAAPLGGATSASGPAGDEPAIAAARQLTMARLYIRNGHPDKARPLLAEILAKYPDTPSADEARQILAGLPK